MARNSVSFGPERSTVVFPNGTTLQAHQAVRATQFTNDGGRLRSASLPSEIDTSPAFEQAMNALGIFEAETIHLDLNPTTVDRGQTDTVVLEPAIPQTAPEQRVVVLYQDESGGLSWHFAEQATPPIRTQRASRLRSPSNSNKPRFVIPLRTQAARKAARGQNTPTRFRGPITKWGRKILKVLVLPVAAHLLSDPFESLVGAIERRKRSDRIWRLTPDNYDKAPEAGTEFRDWAEFDGKPALLVIHGIFSSVEGMLSGLPRAAMERLVHEYDGRVVAFNHLSVSKTPEENAIYFLEAARQAHPQGQFQFDILCHSRGGIVARTLAERGQELLAGNCDFRRIFFVASPNNGSALGDPSHVVDMIDVFTNLLTLFPDGPVLYSIEVLLAIVKLLAYTFEVGLPGVAAMGTQTYIRRVLNAGTSNRPREYYAAAASDYEPNPEDDNGFLTGPFVNYIVDRVFQDPEGDSANDLVVPRSGVYSANGNPLFPIANPLLFGKTDRVWHSGFFSRPEVLKRINNHFGIEDTIFSVITRGGFRGGGDLRDRDLEASGRMDKGSTTDEQQSYLLKRDPKIDFPGIVSEGETKTLTVELSEGSSRRSEGLLIIPLGREQSAIELGVSVSAPGFSLKGPREKVMAVRRSRKAIESVTFELEARNPGDRPVSREIRADFWLDNTCIGAASHTVTVIPKGYVGPVPSKAAEVVDTVRVPRVPRDKCDLIVGVQHIGGSGDDAYEISLRSDVPGRSYEFKDAGILRIEGKQLGEWVNELVDPKFAAFPADPTLNDEEYEAAVQAWNQDFISWIKDIGRKLWIQLPDRFREEYFRLQKMEHPPRSIAIYSDEMIFPWELVIPWSEDGELPPLGVGHVLGRWKPGLGLRPDLQKFWIRTFLVMNPTYEVDSLPWTSQEIEEMKKIIPTLTVVKPCDMPTVQRILNRSDIQFLHFSGHGRWAEGRNADLNAIELEDGTALAAISFVGRPIGRGNPILYLNACTVGRGALAMGRSGGFTANCLESGWTGIIAPYWPINDVSAMHFASNFYTLLKCGRSIGEALQELRAEHPYDPTYQAYAYIGDPMVRVLFPEDGLENKVGG